jgi:hypothetical protein
MVLIRWGNMGKLEKIRASINEIVLGSSSQLFRDFEARPIKIANYIVSSENNVKEAFKRYISESTNFKNDALKKQADRIIIDLKPKPDPDFKELKLILIKFMEAQGKYQVSSSKTFITIIDLISQTASHNLIEARNKEQIAEMKAMEPNLTNLLKKNEDISSTLLTTINEFHEQDEQANRRDFGDLMELINNTASHDLIEAKSTEQMEATNMINEKIRDVKEEIQVIMKGQRKGYESLVNLIALVNEYQELSVQDKEDRNQMLKSILNKPTTSYKKNFENIGNLINSWAPQKLIDAKCSEQNELIQAWNKRYRVHLIS